MSLEKRKLLSYCTNVIPYSNSSYLQNVIEVSKSLNCLSVDNFEMGLGLWLPHQAVDEITKEQQEPALFEELKALNLFTLNGFPYADFHQSRVKENVYLPDLNSIDRIDYLKKLAKFACKSSKQKKISISTLPVGYAALSTISEQTYKTLELLGEYLDQLFLENGVQIQIGLELEPDGLIQRTAEAKVFFERLYNRAPNLARYIGVCVDACHLAVNFERPQEIAKNLKGILIAKLQVSSAIKSNALESFKNFIEPKYLHQTRFKTSSEEAIVKEFKDLDEAFETYRFVENWPVGEWRSHFHVPVYWQGGDQIQSTQKELREVLAIFFGRHTQLECEHFEIETYTYDVLPKEMQIGLLGQMQKEIAHVDQLINEITNETTNEPVEFRALEC